LWAVQILVIPLAGLGCFADEWTEMETRMMGGMLREINVFTIGFFLYADRGGIKVWNVGMVFAIYLVFMIVWLSTGSTVPERYPSCADTYHAFTNAQWVTMVWATLAFIAAIVDDRMGERSGAEGERVPLVS